jgi:thiol-disulfide isomerase/thioredoxin
MKIVLTLTFAFFTLGVMAQNKKTVYYDSAGLVTTRDGHWAQVISGKYKSIYNENENKMELVRLSTEEFESALNKTESRITKTNKLGTDFPEFDEIDVNGNRLTKKEFKGKIIVINIWFIGCPPCEMERSSLNDLTKVYSDIKNVVFISFAAKNNKEQIVKYMQQRPISYNVVPMDKDFLKKFDIHEYPVNIIVDRNGKYLYNSSGTGTGISTILQRKIDKALKE